MRARALVALLLTLAALAWLDRWIGRWEEGGPYRQEIPRPITAVMRAPEAQHIVLGCSTSNWFAPAIAAGWKLPGREVVDAHMSDCLQACTLAEARRLQSLGRHFRTATFGVNTFEYCEEYRERRSMQEVELMPLADTLDLARVYLHSTDPLRYAGGWLMNQVSLTYGNTMWLQRHARKLWFGDEGGSSAWFEREPGPRRKRSNVFGCDYSAADRDFGLAATRGALRAMLDLADRVQLVLLPDRDYAADTEVARTGRELFVAEHRALVAQLQRVELIELLDPTLLDPQLFRDGAHLNSRGVKRARAVLSASLSELPQASLP
ncbi:MAG TPA: hypothetical protein VFS67_19425 [Polyangiaceae bacterium]|nr:hypothetical protein [Polyangiaceae bacterium]